MINYKLFFIGIIAMLMLACSLDDKLKSSDGVYVAVMESADTVKVLPGDTLKFKFVASTNNSFLERVEITDKTFDFEDVAQNVQFTMVDESLELSLDSNGYFSRPVSSVMVLYPITVPKKFDLVGQCLGMTIRVSNTAGKSGSVSSFFKVSNCKTRTGAKYVYDKGGYDCTSHTVYSLAQIKKSINIQKSIDLVCWKDPETGKYYYLSPSSPKAAEVMSPFIADWSSDSVKTTSFILPDMANADYKKVGDNEMNALDFSKGTDRIEIQPKTIIGYITGGGRRCLLDNDLRSNYPLLNGCRYTYFTKEDLEEKEQQKTITE